MLRAEKLVLDKNKIYSAMEFGDKELPLAWLSAYDVAGEVKVRVDFRKNSGISLDEVPALISWLQSLIEEVPE